MTELLRKALHEAESVRAVAKATGLDHASLIRFMRDDGSLRLDLADKLAKHFRYRIISEVQEMIDTTAMSNVDLTNQVLIRLGTEPVRAAHGGYTPDFPAGRKCEVRCRGEGSYRSLRVGFAFNGSDAKEIGRTAAEQIRQALGRSVAEENTPAVTYVGFEIPVPSRVRDGFFDGVADLAEAVSGAIDPRKL